MSSPFAAGASHVDGVRRIDILRVFFSSWSNSGVSQVLATVAVSESPAMPNDNL